MADTHQTTTSTEGEFGTSDFGERLDYAKPKYQDLWAFILFYVHVIVIIAVAIYFWTVAVPEALEDVTTTSTTEAPEDDTNTAGIWITLVCALFAGALFGMLWLQCIKLFAETIIKILLFVQIACWVIVALLGLLLGAIPLLVIGIIFALITCLYAWCIWSRIPFAGACLSIASQITQTYHGTVWLSLITVVINFIWVVIWICAFWAYVISTGDEGGNNIIVFLLLISLYWGVNVWRNVSHTTTCGVAATWYFSAGLLDNPSKAAWKRTVTTSFGSICFGSLLVAILQAIRAMLKGTNNGCARCLLLCIERIMRYFNKYAFAQVAIYGTSFWQSAKATWDLFMSNGLSALINDDLSGLALTCGAVLGAVASGIAGFFVAQVFYNDIFLSVYLAILGAIFGYYVVVIILLVVASGVVAIFVCFAEDPAACKANRPEAFDKLTGVSEDMRNMANNRGV